MLLPSCRARWSHRGFLLDSPEPSQPRYLMRRIGLAVVLAVSLALAAHAQGPRLIPHIGIVAGASPAAGRANVDAFRQGLREAGYVEGQNIIVEERWAEGQSER